MSLVDLEEVHTGYSISKINSNFQKLQQVLNYNREKRDIATNNEFQKKFKAGDEGNEMRTDIVMGNNKVINPVGIVTLRDIYEIVGYPEGTCTVSADIMLVIDNSGSQNLIEYTTLVKPSIVSMINSFISLGRDMTIGFSLIKTIPTLEFGLTSDLSSVANAVSIIPQPGGTTNLGDAITLAKNELDMNGREGTPGIILIYTDGVPNVPTIDAEGYATAAATAAKDAGYRVVVVGVMGIDNTEQEGGGAG